MSEYEYVAQGIDIRTGDVIVEFGISSKAEYEAGAEDFLDRAEELNVKKFKIYARGEGATIFETVSVDPFDARMTVLIQMETFANGLG